MASADDVYDWEAGHAYEWEFVGNPCTLNPYEVKCEWLLGFCWLLWMYSHICCFVFCCYRHLLKAEKKFVLVIKSGMPPNVVDIQV